MTERILLVIFCVMVKMKQGKRPFSEAESGPNLSPANDAELIDALGGPAALRDELAQRVGRNKAPTRVVTSMWKRRGIAPDWRYEVAEIARQRGISLYENFLAPAVVRKGTDEAAPAA